MERAREIKRDFIDDGSVQAVRVAGMCTRYEVRRTRYEVNVRGRRCV